MPTKIEWCEETWNPIVGCSKVSPGCKNCYAERMAFRLSKMGVYPYTEVISDGRKWNGKTRLSERNLLKPYWQKKSRKIFVCSMGDLFHESIPDGIILEIYELMRLASQHTFLVLTKRAARMVDFYRSITQGNDKVKPIPNIWVGVTAENQETANERIPLLLQVPAVKRFVSAEPLLSHIDFYEHQGGPKLNWVICGGESGPGARPLDPEWVRSIRDQCKDAGVPFFFKQWGEYMPVVKYGETIESPKKVGKKAAGSTLDGKKYKQYPV